MCARCQADTTSYRIVVLRGIRVESRRSVNNIVNRTILFLCHLFPRFISSLLWRYSRLHGKYRLYPLYPKNVHGSCHYSHTHTHRDRKKKLFDIAKKVMLTNITVIPFYTTDKIHVYLPHCDNFNSLTIPHSHIII